MRVAYDATTLTMRRSGIGRYTLELLRALMTHERDIEIRLMAHRAISMELRQDGLASVQSLRGPRFPIKLAWMQTMLPVQLAASDVELCHFTNYHAPLASPRPMVVNLHDMSLLYAPERHPTKRVATMRPLLRATASRADAVICLTQSGRRDAISALDIDPERVHVIPGAPAAAFRPIDDGPELQAVADRYVLRPGFLLFVGTIEPRKNLDRLIQAYTRLREAGFDEPLVMAGQFGWKYGPILERIEALGMSSHVRMLGYVSDSDLAGLMNLCGAFVYPSLYEGFGLPVLEAMACGAVCVTSDRGAMAEVAAEGALLADPDDVDSLVDVLTTALGTPTVRDRLMAAGPRRAADFSWAQAAGATAALYRSVLEA